MVEIVKKVEAFVEECGFDASIHVLGARPKSGYMPYSKESF